jgi:peroxiredoxin Q/BCP
MSDVVLQNGDPAPDFALPSDTGATVRLSDFRGKRVVLYFYPKYSKSGG